MRFVYDEQGRPGLDYSDEPSGFHEGFITGLFVGVFGTALGFLVFLSLHFSH